MILAAPLVLLLAQAAVSSDTPDEEGTGTALLQICGNYTGNDKATADTAICLAYIAGLADSIAYYEANLTIMRTLEILIHLGYFARVGELQAATLDKLRSNPATAKTGEGLAKVQADAIAKGAARRTPALTGLKPTNSAIRPRICVPKGVSSTGQLALVIIKYVRDHPERLHESRGLLAIQALQTAFPCPTEDEQATQPGK